MAIRNIVILGALAAAWLAGPVPAQAQNPLEGRLAGVTSIKCTFPLIAVGNWSEGMPTAEVKPVNLELQFDAINTDEGSAQMASGFGAYDIIVRYAGGYLHFVQSFRDGPLYTTTVLERESAGGRFRAMHSRHEYADFALTGFTSSPEQYYGDCEILQ